MFAAVLAFGLTLGGHKPPCSAPLYAACANSRQLVSNRDFQAALRRFLGDHEGRYRRGTRLIYKEVAERLGEPKGPPVDIGAGARLFAGCRFIACPEKAAVIIDRTGVLAVGVIDYHSDVNPSLEVDVQRSGSEAAARAATLKVWADRAVADDSARMHAPIVLQHVTVRALREESPQQQAALQAKACSRFAALIHRCQPQ
jgi:hypothetical protein